MQHTLCVDLESCVQASRAIACGMHPNDFLFVCMYVAGLVAGCKRWVGAEGGLGRVWCTDIAPLSALA